MTTNTDIVLPEIELTDEDCHRARQLALGQMDYDEALMRLTWCERMLREALGREQARTRGV